MDYKGEFSWDYNLVVGILAVELGQMLIDEDTIKITQGTEPLPSRVLQPKSLEYPQAAELALTCALGEMGRQ